MAATVLITGSTNALNEAADAVRAAGGDVVTASAPAELAAALEAIGKGNLKHFLQMPESVKGEPAATITSRVHEFLKQGLLSRYRTAETVLPYLADDAQVVLVSGNVNAEAAAPDDRSARMSLVYVLKHALIADKNSEAFSCRIADPGTPADVLADAILNGKSLGNEARHDAAVAVDPGLDYDDWRIEVLGDIRF